MPVLKSKTISTLAELASVDFSTKPLTESPFFTRSWLVSWCQQYLGANDSIRTIVVYDGEEIVGIAPFCIQRAWGRGNVLRFLGNGDVCSDYQTIPCNSSKEHAVVAEVAREIQSCQDDWDRIELDGVRADNLIVNALADALKDYGFSVNTRRIASCWRLHLPATMDEYLAQNSKNHRKHARRKLKLFESGSVEVRDAIDDASFEEGYRILRELHQRRRNSLGDVGCFASESYNRFLHEAARGLMKEGMLRLFWLQVAGEPIAADIAIKTTTGVFAYQAGISPEHLAHEPGRLANLWHIKRAIEDGLAFVDFLRGDEPYKRLLHAKPISCVKYEVVPARFKSQVCQTFIDGGRTVKALWAGFASSVVD